jgi:Tol biopolymer transport system component
MADGHHLATSRWDEKKCVQFAGIVNVHSGKYTDLANLHYGGVSGSPTRMEFVSLSGDGLFLFDISGEAILKYPVTGYAVEHLGQIAWSPDGELIAVVGKNEDDKRPNQGSRLYVLDRKGKLYHTRTSSSWIVGLNWHPSGDLLGYLGGDDSRYQIIRPHGDEVASFGENTARVAYNPVTGEMARYFGIDGWQMKIEIALRNQQKPLYVASFNGRKDPSMPRQLIWTPDGKRLLFDGCVKGVQGWHLYDIQRKTIATKLIGDSHYHAAISHDGTRVAFRIHGGAVICEL